MFFIFYFLFSSCIAKRLGMCRLGGGGGGGGGDECPKSAILNPIFNRF